MTQRCHPKHTAFHLKRFVVSGTLPMLALLVSITSLARFTDAQVPFRSTRTPSARTNVFLPVPRELKRELDRAKLDIKQQRYVDAITRLNLILQGAGNTDEKELAEDYFLPSSKPGEPLRSLKFEAERLIGSMPPGGMQAYELAYGEDARQLLKAAIIARDFGAIGEVSSRYGHTQAGQEATMLIGRERMAAGDFLEAVRHFRRLTESESASRRFGSELVLMRAVALQSSNQSRAAADVLREFQKANPNAQFSLGSQSIPAPNDDQDLSEWLTKSIGPIAIAMTPPTDEWQLYGGNQQRNATTNAGMPIRSKRWEVPLVIRPSDATTLDRHGKAMRDTGAIPALQPLVVDKWVLYRTANSLLGADLQTGLRQWVYPWDQDSESEPAASRNQFSPGGSRYKNLIKTRVWSDALYGQLSSDGEVVYLLNRLNGEYNPNNTGTTITNELVALELEREGYTLWRVGGPDAQLEDELAGVFFLGVPLPVDDKLYCIAEQNGEIRRLVLDKQTGSLAWSQQLAHVDPRFNGGRGQRRMAGASPSYANNILVCPTSVGGVIAVDTQRRTLLWGFQYKLVTNFRRVSGLTQPWRDNATVIHDGKVILMPWDSKEVFCLDLLTGEPVWPKPISRQDAIYCGGIHNGNVILVAKRQVRAVNLETGKDTWKLALRDNPAGIGIKTGSDYLLATTGPEILRINLDDGQVISTLPTEEPLGNLVVAKDQIIAQNETKLSAFYQQSKLAGRVDRELAKNPNNPWALEKKAVLLLSQGNRDEGLEYLERAIDNYPQDDASGVGSDAEELLVRTVLDMLRTSHPRATELANRIEPLIDSSQLENEFDRMMTLNQRREGRYLEAFQRNLRLFRNLTQQESTNADLRSDVALMTVSRDLSIRQPRWHRSLFLALWNDANQQQRDEMSRLATEAIESSPSAIRKDLVHVLQDLPAVEPLLIAELQQRVQESRTTAITEARLKRLTGSKTPEIAGQATSLLATIYRDAGMNFAAAQAYRRLADSFASVRISDGLNGKEFMKQAIAENEAIRRSVENTNNWNYGAVEISQLTGSRPNPIPRTVGSQPYDTLLRLYPVPIEQPASLSPPGLRFVYDSISRTLQGRDRLGNIHTIANFNNSLGQVSSRNLRVRSNGHYIVAMKGEAIVAMNALQAKNGDNNEAVLWQDTGGVQTNGYSRTASQRNIYFGQSRIAGLGITRSIETGSNGRSPVSLGPITEYGVILRRYGDLTCLDPLSGDIIWSRSDIDLNAEVWGDDQTVFVHPPSSTDSLANKNVRVFSTLDGTELESHPAPQQNQRVRMRGRYVLAWAYDVAGDLPTDMEATVREIIRPDRDVVEVPVEQPGKSQDLLTHRLQVIDILDRKNTELWSRRFSLDAKATFISEDELAVFQPSKNNLQVISTIDGSLKTEAKLTTDLARIDALKVERRAGLIIVTFAKNTDGRDLQSGDIKFKSPAGRLTNLEVHAITPEGDDAWGVPAKLNNFVSPPHYASDLPILIYVRRSEAPKNQSGKRQLQTVVLDARDGHVITSAENQADSQNVFQVRGNQELQEVRLRLPSLNGAMRLKFTDKPRPPSPPYGYGAATTRQQADITNFPMNFFRTIAPGVLPAELPAGPPIDKEVEDLFR